MKKIFLTILAILLIIEEWLWDLLSICGHYLVKILRLQRLENWLMQTSPQTALICFIIPILIVTPINLAAIHLLLLGMIVQGILLEIVAKLLGTLLVARVFTLTKPQLLTFSMINRVYSTITDWLRWAHAKIVEIPIYIYAKRLKAEVKDWITRLFK